MRSRSVSYTHLAVYKRQILILVVLAAVALFLLFRAWPLIGGDQRTNSDVISSFTGGKATSYWGYVCLLYTSS